MLLPVAKMVIHFSTFSGKIKLVFTVEEEAGLVGASKVDEYFLWGTHATIVVERRGTSDIVTSCLGTIPFCEDGYGEFIEQVAKEADLTDWKCTQGGSSDTIIWASHGIQSINLSVGYYHEHTDAECLDIRACYKTTQLLRMFLEKERELVRTLRMMWRKRMDCAN